MILINKGLIIFLLLIFFTIIGFASASNNDSYNNLQNYEKSINHEKDSNHILTINNPTNKKNLEEKSLNSKKYNELVSSQDNNSNLSNSNKINYISNSETQHIIIKEYKYYNSNCSLIQNIITEAPPKSTIEFTGSLYNDLSLNINKPLNIISNVGSTITITTNSPAFTISNGGSGTSINGFTIKGNGPFVNAHNVSNINLENNEISSETGIIFYNVFNSKIQNNNFLDFKKAIDIRKSGAITISKNNIHSKKIGSIGINLEDDTDSSSIKILDNILVGSGSNIDFESIGINVGTNVYNILINGNSITNWYNGIYFKNSINNVNISNNTINQNNYGVILESGKLKGFSFTKNLVKDNKGYGILLDEDVEGYTFNPVVENNYFTKNGMDMRSVGDTGFEIGNNFVERLCQKFYMRMGFRVKFLKNGNNIIATVIGSKNNRVSDLPNFQGTLNIDGTDYNLQFKNGIAYLDISNIVTGSGDGLGNSQFGVGEDSRSITKWGYSVHSMSDSELESYLQEHLGYSNNKNTKKEEDKKEEQSNSTSKQESGSKSYGSSSGESYVSSSSNSPSNSVSSSSSADSGSSSSSSSSSSATSATDSTSTNPTTSSSQESPGADGSSSSNPTPKNNVVAKEISVDEEKYKVAGVVGLITLILLVIGMYYREDVFEMIGNN